MSTEGRHTVPAEAYWHEEEQQAEFEGSQTEPVVNLQAAECQFRSLSVELLYALDESQHAEVTPDPGSHSSPASTIPSGLSQRSLERRRHHLLPHCCRLIRVFEAGGWIQVVEKTRVPMLEQTLPSVQLENICSVDEVVGFMMNLPSASHVLVA